MLRNAKDSRYALTAVRRIPHGLQCLSVSIYVLTAPLIIATSASTYLSFDQPTLTVSVLVRAEFDELADSRAQNGPGNSYGR